MSSSNPKNLYNNHEIFIFEVFINGIELDNMHSKRVSVQMQLESLPIVDLGLSFEIREKQSLTKVSFGCKYMSRIECFSAFQAFPFYIFLVDHKMRSLCASGVDISGIIVDSYKMNNETASFSLSLPLENRNQMIVGSIDVKIGVKHFSPDISLIKKISKPVEEHLSQNVSMESTKTSKKREKKKDKTFPQVNPRMADVYQLNLKYRQTRDDLLKQMSVLEKKVRSIDNLAQSHRPQSRFVFKKSQVIDNIISKNPQEDDHHMVVTPRSESSEASLDHSINNRSTSTGALNQVITLKPNDIVPKSKSSSLSKVSKHDLSSSSSFTSYHSKHNDNQKSSQHVIEFDDFISSSKVSNTQPNSIKSSFFVSTGPLKIEQGSIKIEDSSKLTKPSQNSFSSDLVLDPSSSVIPEKSETKSQIGDDISYDSSSLISQQPTSSIKESIFIGDSSSIKKPQLDTSTLKQNDTVIESENSRIDVVDSKKFDSFESSSQIPPQSELDPSISASFVESDHENLQKNESLSRFGSTSSLPPNATSSNLKDFDTSSVVSLLKSTKLPSNADVTSSSKLKSPQTSHLDDADSIISGLDFD